ncbi:RUN domain-containing protein [Echinococcus granulosus]|uniref:RUN domain-containing protein n=1 Tax=Echinococcus granulosus TaxID=6210 RepID=W6UTF4_ECHGR|nr:RUN domain-containing protein [Echinococcus granulosus]EUB61642.1 RUN domain-containing protein [Echinococcus granulosus]
MAGDVCDPRNTFLFDSLIANLAHSSLIGQCRLRLSLAQTVNWSLTFCYVLVRSLCHIVDMMESFADFDNATIFAVKAPVDEEGKPIERWAPLGANDSPDLSTDENISVSDSTSSDKLRSNTEEHENLNSSLLLMTSHFAQVQFRLEQVLQADPEEKEILLRDLEQFAWKGVPDLHALRLNQPDFQASTEGLRDDQRKNNMSHMIDQLKSQLHDLEQFAYKSGEIQQPPTQNVLEKQRLVLEELGKHLDLNVSEFPSLSAKEIRERVNAGLNQLTRPIKTKEALVDQLKTQILDLERFIDFLHDEGAPNSVIGKALEAFRRYQQEQRSKTPTIQLEREDEHGYVEGGYQIGLSRRRQNAQDSFNQSKGFVSEPEGQFGNQKMVGLITRALTMLQVFATMQLANRRAKMRQQAERYAKSAGTRKNGSQVTGAKTHHWGDIRARLEMAVETVLEKAERLRQIRQEHNRQLQTSVNSSSISLNEGARQPSDSRVTTERSTVKLRDLEFVKAERDLSFAVRKHFCPALEALIEHGSRLPVSTRERGVDRPKTSLLSSFLSLLGCFSRNRPEVLSYPSKFVDDNDVEDEEDDSYDEENEETGTKDIGRNYYTESEEERRARVLRKRDAQSSAWAIFLKYYVLTNGRAFNDTPARKLSESFSLDIIGGKVVTAKQHLLSSMGTIMQEFGKYKRSEEAQFNALVCIGLNSRRLISWLKLVLRSPLIVQYMYHPWSYVTSTGFDDALRSLNKLSSVEFELPFDANIRHLQSINDAF